MAVIEQTTEVSLISILAYRVANAVSNLVAEIAALHDAQRTRKALMELTNAELDDIGLCRGDIDRVARRRF